ncbi:MAG: electron transport complex subunit RsxE [Dehalococcoidia bacterium]|nr:MAG: electron transport complex subunit RsxE [Dehalococcoidia bacterium]
MAKFWKQFLSGIVITNPLFVLALGLCPALAVSVTVTNGIGMSLATAFVLLGSAIVVSSIKNFVPNIVRIPIFIVVIASFVTIADLTLKAFIPTLADSLGIFLPLIVVNCIIMGRAEAFGSKHPVHLAIADALGAAVGFAIAMIIISFLREVLGTGQLAFKVVPYFDIHLFTLPVLGTDPMALFILPPGAFLLIGLLLALFRRLGVLKSE